MTFHRHPSFFPLVVFLLTCVLGFFMFSVFRQHAVSSNAAPVSQTEPAVNDATYRPALKNILAPVVASGEKNSATIDTALAAMLQLRVPSDDQQADLDFALALSQLSAGLKGNAAALADGQQKWQAAVTANAWAE